MVAGDMSEIGQRGINLSGGQKARLSLARAVYTNPDIILLDDPISALDSIVKKKVFSQVFNGLLKDKTRILVTHAVEFIHLADRVVLMKDGCIEAMGTPEELKDHEYIRELADI
jgi:ABC-type multidrug transport system fused ATPase/permease subunit